MSFFAAMSASFLEGSPRRLVGYAAPNAITLHEVCGKASPPGGDRPPLALGSRGWMACWDANPTWIGAISQRYLLISVITTLLL
jgi:hypothetical protein